MEDKSYKVRVESLGEEQYIKIPKEILSELGWTTGDEIIVETTMVCSDIGEEIGIVISKANEK